MGFIILATCLNFKESLSTTRRSKDKITKSLKLFKKVFKNKEFMFYNLQMSFAMAILFAYIAASPFIIQQHYGFSPLAFSLFFGINAILIGVGAGVSARFKREENAIKISVSGMIICSILLLIALTNNANIFVFETFLLMLCFMLGLTFTATTTKAMNSARNNAGTASAILGAGGFLFGSIVSPIVGLGDILLSTGLTFVVSAVMSGLFAFMVLRTTRKTAKSN